MVSFRKSYPAISISVTVGGLGDLLTGLIDRVGGEEHRRLHLRERLADAETGAAAERDEAEGLGRAAVQEVEEDGAVGSVEEINERATIAALVAVVHDILITVGVYSISRFEVTPATVVAFLTILGYSLYDTIVVFDKVEENSKASRPPAA